MTLVYYHPHFLDHLTGAHPERPARLTQVVSHLEREQLFAHCRRETWDPISDPRLARIHQPEYAARLKSFADAGGGRIEVDTVVSEASYKVARLAAGAVADAVEARASMGLAISSRLVGFMRGRIWVESVLGKGSRFHFTAHFALQKNPVKTTVRRDPMTLRDMRVLVVDDNATYRHILLKMLANWHAIPTAVENGAKAITALREAQGPGGIYHLILLDAHMPHMDGFALAEYIKGNPAWKAATIMMLSSAGQRGDAKRCRDLGVDAYLTKPVRQEELLDAILTALGTRPAGQPEPVLVTRHSLRENSSHLRILLVEDNAVNQVLAVRLLQKRGHTVAVAGNGKEALVALENQSFDLVFMDVQMPDMDGFEATAAIRRKELASGNHLPIIAVTAHAMVGGQRTLSPGRNG